MMKKMDKLYFSDSVLQHFFITLITSTPFVQEESEWRL